MKGLCPGCKIEKSLFIYHVCPQQWHEAGPTAHLCHKCIIRLDNDFPLITRLTQADYEERLRKFLNPS